MDHELAGSSYARYRLALLRDQAVVMTGRTPVWWYLSVLPVALAIGIARPMAKRCRSIALALDWLGEGYE